MAILPLPSHSTQTGTELVFPPSLFPICCADVNLSCSLPTLLYSFTGPPSASTHRPYHLRDPYGFFPSFPRSSSSGHDKMYVPAQVLVSKLLFPYLTYPVGASPVNLCSSCKLQREDRGSTNPKLTSLYSSFVPSPLPSSPSQLAQYNGLFPVLVLHLIEGTLELHSFLAIKKSSPPWVLSPFSGCPDKPPSEVLCSLPTFAREV